MGERLVVVEQSVRVQRLGGNRLRPVAQDVPTLEASVVLLGWPRHSI